MIPTDIIFKILEFYNKLGLPTLCQKFNEKYSPLIRHTRKMRDIRYILPVSYLYRTRVYRDREFRQSAHEFFLICRMECMEHCAALHRLFDKRNPKEYSGFFMLRLIQAVKDPHTPEIRREVYKEYIDSKKVITDDELAGIKKRWNSTLRPSVRYIFNPKYEYKILL
jgi:hypothetical protein